MQHIPHKAFINTQPHWLSFNMATNYVESESSITSSEDEDLSFESEGSESEVGELRDIGPKPDT